MAESNNYAGKDLEKSGREMDFGGAHQDRRCGHRRCVFSRRLRSKVRTRWESVLPVAVGVLTLPTINRRRVAIGLENGHILIYSSSSTNPSEWRLELTIDSSYVPRLTISLCPADHFSRNAHVEQIHRIAWRPLTAKEEGGGGTIKKQLASCSEDHTLRILNVLLKV